MTSNPIADRMLLNSRLTMELDKRRSTMTTLRQLHDAMWSYNQSVAYGSECNAWQDFVDDCHGRCGVAPWADDYTQDLPGDFARYWMDVANGHSHDYYAENGSRA